MPQPAPRRCSCQPFVAQVPIETYQERPRFHRVVGHFDPGLGQSRRDPVRPQDHAPDAPPSSSIPTAASEEVTTDLGSNVDSGHRRERARLTFAGVFVLLLVAKKRSTPAVTRR